MDTDVSYRHKSFSVYWIKQIWCKSRAHINYLQYFSFSVFLFYWNQEFFCDQTDWQNWAKLISSWTSSRPELFCKKGVLLKNFTKFTGKTCFRVPFLIKLHAWGLQPSEVFLRCSEYMQQIYRKKTNKTTLLKSHLGMAVLL